MLNINRVRKVRKALYGLSVPAIQSNYDLNLEDTKTSIDLDRLFLDIGNTLMYLGAVSGNPTLLKLGTFGNTMMNNYSILKNLKGTNKKDKTNGIAQVVGNTFDTGKNLLFDQSKNSQLTLGLNSLYDTASSVMMKVNPMIGSAMKIGGFIGDGMNAIGLGTDLITTSDKILDSNFLKLTIPGLINTFGAAKTDKFGIDYDTVNLIGGGYMGTVADINQAQLKLNKSFGLFSRGLRNKTNRFINNTSDKQNTMSEIAKNSLDYKDMLKYNLDIFNLNYQNLLNGGLFAKEGTKLPEILDKINLDWKPTISKYEEDTWQPVITQIDLCKEGGKLEEDVPKIKESTQQNIIPEGALHKNKHHMENDEHITKKGIPVIDNDGELLAEIELNEIIFTLEVTNKLEELYKLYYNLDTKSQEKDNLAVEAGKLLVHEILFNTLDRTGLIDTLKLGGKINGTS